MPNCHSISGLQPTLAPASISMKQPLLFGITGAKAMRLMPFMRFTMNVEPMVSAPLLPPETNASPSPTARRLKPSAIDEFDFDLSISPASSSMVITSGASAISMPSSGILLPSAAERISLSRPVSSIFIPRPLTASAHPFIISRGALSPPKASTIIFISDISIQN